MMTTKRKENKMSKTHNPRAGASTSMELIRAIRVIDALVAKRMPSKDEEYLLATRESFIAWVVVGHNGSPIEKLNNKEMIIQQYESFERWCERNHVDPGRGGLSDYSEVILTQSADCLARSAEALIKVSLRKRAGSPDQRIKSAIVREITRVHMSTLREIAVMMVQEVIEEIHDRSDQDRRSEHVDDYAFRMAMAAANKIAAHTESAIVVDSIGEMLAHEVKKCAKECANAIGQMNEQVDRADDNK